MPVEGTNPSNSTSTVLELGRVVKAGPGTVYAVTFCNTNAAVRFLQFYNSTTVPADSAVPVLTFHVAASASVNLDWSNVGRYFSTGIAVASSTTAATKTASGADGFFDVQYV
jgi:hypothetical protein